LGRISAALGRFPGTLGDFPWISIFGWASPIREYADFKSLRTLAGLFQGAFTLQEGV
jgi:hypothetical protein